MKFKLTKYRRLHPLTAFKLFFSSSSLDNQPKRKIFGQKPLKLSMKVKSVLSIAIIVIMLVSVFAFLPKGNNAAPDVPQNSDVPIASPNATPQRTTNPTRGSNPLSDIANAISGMSNAASQILNPRAPGVIESAQTMNSAVWQAVAANAWNYFQPGTGVDPNTGLPYGGSTDAPNFTDWDLGSYIQAVIDAQKIGVIGTGGAWNSSQRLETVVKFLETRDLNSTTHYPYWFYQAKDGKDYNASSDLASSPVDVVDTGRLFVALNNLRAYNSSLAIRINNIVLYGQNFNRSNYAVLVPGIYADSRSSTSIYAYLIANGFASFWPNDLYNAPSQILTNMLSSGNVTTYGVSLPLASILGDPLLYSVFELNNNNSQLMAITRQVYLAHEAYYNATGKYRAFSEGGTLSSHWAYEWVVLPDNRTWTILDEKSSNYDISPIIYTKISLGFLAIYNTTYAHDMAVYLEQNLPDPTKGYCEGVDESGAQLIGLGVNTNSLIIEAANYAIQNNP
jgi:hypothetical protein